MSSICASSPSRAMRLRAARITSSRLRRASARWGRTGVAVVVGGFMGLSLKRNRASGCVTIRNRNSGSDCTRTPDERQVMTDFKTAEDRRWIALILLCVAQFVVVLDASIVNVALPTIGDALNFTESNLPWVVNAYVLTFGGFLLLGGRMADLLGRRRVFIAGLILFALASLAGGLATTSGQLVAARAVQGLGAAILSPAALSIVTTTFRDGSERNRALGVWGAVAGSGGAAGVLLGGVLTDGLGWEWVLWVNVPIGLIARGGGGGGGGVPPGGGAPRGGGGGGGLGGDPPGGAAPGFPPPASARGGRRGGGPPPLRLRRRGQRYRRPVAARLCARGRE